MTVAGQIRPDYDYFVLFNTTNSPAGSQGPIPIVAPPWGNGFAAGQFTSFIRIDQTQPNSGYGVYAVVPGSNLRSFNYIGSPVQFTPVTAGTSTIQFQIPISELATSTISASQISTLQINFISTNRVPIDPNDTSPKLFDALGDATQIGGVNDPITISTAQSRVYQNSDFVSNPVQHEPSGDVTQAGNGIFIPANDPDLDIVNWSVEVRT
jgi:hypothetical protein